MRMTGVEPARVTSQDPKSCASTNSATSANLCYFIIKFFFYQFSLIFKKVCINILTNKNLLLVLKLVNIN